MNPCFYNEDNQGCSPTSGAIGAIYKQGISIGLYVVDQKWGNDSELFTINEEIVSKLR